MAASDTKTDVAGPEGDSNNARADQPLQAPEPGLVVPGADPTPHAAAPRSVGVYLLALIAVVIAIAAYVLLSRREAPELNPPTADAPATASRPEAVAPVTLDIPEEPALLGEEPAHAAPTPSPDKIFNSATDALKEGVVALKKNAPEPSATTINELPAPPVASGGNHSMQDAAKDAAKVFSTMKPQDEGVETAPPPELEPEAGLPRSDALARALAADRLRADQLANEVARLKAAQRAGAEAALALARADAGAPSADALEAAFPAARNAALAAVRADGAKGPAARAGASLAAFVNLRRAGPTEGPEATAVMSRAEAAVDAGDLERALRELAALPDAGASAMADWRAGAERRVAIDRAARAAAQTLIALNTERGAP
jgi:hypothetical protein